jgi:pimeloyl-ACP methyl ester carboxylesterase
VSFADEGTVIKLDTRPGASAPFYYLKRDGASATVVLLMGGGGDIGLKGSVPTSGNFLVRNRERFAANGFNVALIDRPTDRELDFDFRLSSEHIHDLRQVVRHVKTDTGLPVWLIGHSRGTVSAAAGAIAFGNEELAGVVLTASVTSAKRRGAVPTQKLDAIRIPVLVVHHEKDACATTMPSEARLITEGLKNAPVKRQMMLNGGANPEGEPCDSSHWHGFVGMERETVDRIVAWIRDPKP